MSCRLQADGFWHLANCMNQNFHDSRKKAYSYNHPPFLHIISGLAQGGLKWGDPLVSSLT
jgi:hypothetical protein